MAKYFDPNDYETELEAVTDGLFAIARAIRDLGNANAATPMGALEALGVVLKEGLGDIAVSLEEGLL